MKPIIIIKRAWGFGFSISLDNDYALHRETTDDTLRMLRSLLEGRLKS